MVQEPKVSLHYQGGQGERYVAHHQSDPESIGFALNFKYFKPYVRPTDVALDFGCGNGGLLRLLMKHVARAEGLEVNPAAAAMARQSGARVYERLSELPTTPVYDFVMSNHVLEHVRDVPSTLERIRESMKPGARLVVNLPIDDHREAYQRTITPGDINHHLHTWTPRLFANVLHETGFEACHARIITSAFHPKLFPLIKLGLAPVAFWALSVIRRRRQLFMVGHVPDGATPCAGLDRAGRPESSR